jgi:glutamate dehydrogenase
MTERASNEIRPPLSAAAESATTKYDNPAMLDRLTLDFRAAAEKIVPEFLTRMPAAYYHDMDDEVRLSHLKAIIALEASGQPQEVVLRNAQGTRYTCINAHSYPGQLHELVRRLPNVLPLCSAQVYTATDGSRVLDVFNFGRHALFDATVPEQLHRQKHLLAYATAQPEAISSAEFVHYLEDCTDQYVLKVPPEKMYRHFLLVQNIRATGNCLVELKKRSEYGLTSLVVGINRLDRRLLFERITWYLGKQGINIQRAYVDSFGLADDQPVSLLSFLVQAAATGPTESSDPDWREIGSELQRLCYLDDKVLWLAEKLPEWSLRQTEVLLTLTHLVHQLLVKKDALAFAGDRILAVAMRYPQHVMKIIDLFLDRFNPGQELDFEERFTHLEATIAQEVDKENEQEILSAILASVAATQRSNVNFPSRYALILRIDPSFLCTADREEVPFGVFFVHGQGFDGFHVRFQDIARGGIRIVKCIGQEHYALESERLYDEVYNLAHAQQLKNKDIPEGGSKGVILAQPESDLEQVGRAFTDALLDLIVPATDLHNNCPDYYGKQESLYLGPDENISNELILWIVQRAQQRGHPMPNVFMSSKPGAGINHKVYGVTSEGVTVFLEAALRALGIDPRRQRFTLKMTGGPDGDVAGNEIRILEREFGANACILGIADGSGCLEDPEGLDHSELLRLVTAELPVTEFNPRCLSPAGRLLSINQAGGVQARNSLHNRLITDAFIPAGGRPRTINEDNWQDFLTGDGTASSRVVVEGANIFITAQARLRLSEHGVMIIKDSSANKTGVICSSYEIIAGMILSEPEFLRIKDLFIEQVIAKLKSLTSLEAEMLFLEHRHRPGISLPELSTRLSRSIIRATEAIARSINELHNQDKDLTGDLVREYLPSVLFATAGDSVFTRVPADYLTRVIASSLSSRIVYREGLEWFEHMPDDAIAQLAMQYLQQEGQIKRLVEQVNRSALPDREIISGLLREGGTRTALRNRIT